MRNEDIAAKINAIGDLLEIKGESRFRVNAYRDAARHLEELTEDLNLLAAEGRLRSIAGVGDAIATKIEELLTTGKLGYYERLKEEVPESLLELLQIPGLGPRKVKLLYDGLGVRDLAALRQAIAEGRVASLPGMGAKTVENLKRELERYEQRGSRVSLGLALPTVQGIISLLSTRTSAASRVAEAGSVRRRRDSIGDLDVLAASDRPAEVLEAFATLPVAREVVARGETKVSILVERQQQVDLRVVAPEAWGAALQYFTGSKAHNVRLREIAIRKGLRLNEYGLFEAATERRVASAEEAEVYERLGLVWIPPELREDRGEIEAALAHRLPHLIDVADVRGELHATRTGATERRRSRRCGRRRGLVVSSTSP